MGDKSAEVARIAQRYAAFQREQNAALQADKNARIQQNLVQADAVIAGEEKQKLDAKQAEIDKLQQNANAACASLQSKYWQHQLDKKFFDMDTKVEIGAGASATVYKVSYKSPGCRTIQVALKVFTTSNAIGSTETVAYMQDETKLLSKLAKCHHENIVTFYGLIFDGIKPTAIALEYVNGRDLYYYLYTDKNFRFTLEQKNTIISKIIQAMAYVHEHIGIIHRDIKSSNIMIMHDGDHYVPKITDFGVGKELSNNLVSSLGSGGATVTAMTCNQGTPLWMAPEVMRGQPYNQSCDVYSFGLVVYELATGKLPWPKTITLLELKNNICRFKKRPIIPKDCDPNLKHLMEICWAENQEKRPSFIALESLRIQNEDHKRRATMKAVKQAEELEKTLVLSKLIHVATCVEDTCNNPFVGYKTSAMVRTTLEIALDDLQAISLQLKDLSMKREEERVKTLTNKSISMLETLKKVDTIAEMFRIAPERALKDLKLLDGNLNNTISYCIDVYGNK